MNIVKENVDGLNALLRINIEKNDYEQKVNTTLGDYRRKANINGFRPGKAPMGLINKMYGKAVLLDEINKMISESISKYISEEKINILGEPLPSEKEQKAIDWDKQTEFEFVFDLGLAPEVDIELSKKIKVPFYDIKVDDKMISTYKEGYAKRYGVFNPRDVVEGGEIVKGTLVQLDDGGNPMEDGIKTEDVTLAMDRVKDEDIKKQFIGLKTGDKVSVDLKKAFPNDSDLAALLKIEKAKVGGLTPMFQFEVKTISKFESTEINQELFNKIYGEGVVNSEQEFEGKIIEEIKQTMKKESEYRFVIDAKDNLIEKANLTLPQDFLKRWLFYINEGKFSKEQISKDFDHFESDLKWQLIKNSLINKYEISVSEEEVKELAKEVVMVQFRQYGIANIPDEYLANYAEDMLKKEEERKKIFEKKYEDKVAACIMENVKLENKEVSTEEFNKLFEK